MDDITDRRAAPPGWIEVLVQSKAEIEAGLTVPLEPVLARLQASLDRMEARHAEQVKRPARQA
jgi:hypothetical protein